MRPIARGLSAVCFLASLLWLDAIITAWYRGVGGNCGSPTSTASVVQAVVGCAGVALLSVGLVATMRLADGHAQPRWLGRVLAGAALLGTIYVPLYLASINYDYACT